MLSCWQYSFCADCEPHVSYQTWHFGFSLSTAFAAATLNCFAATFEILSLILTREGRSAPNASWLIERHVFACPWTTILGMKPVEWLCFVVAARSWHEGQRHCQLKRMQQAFGLAQFWRRAVSAWHVDRLRNPLSFKLIWPPQLGSALLCKCWAHSDSLHWWIW